MMAPEGTKAQARGWTFGPMAGTLLALLPKATCPLCVAAYAGTVSSLGLGFLLTDRVLTPIIICSLLLSVGSVAWAWTRHHRFGPVVISVVGAIALAAGRWFALRALLPIGLVLLVSASVWTLWLQRSERTPLIRLK
jgi:fermentation-respiration switch protein FrsA (DUF1100 family)